MKFGMLALGEAEGAILAHTLRAGGAVLKKGQRLGAEAIGRLSAAGVREVMAARLEPGDIGEDEVAARVARAFAGEGVRVAPARTGRANLFAEVAGLWQVVGARVDAVNGVDESITLATLEPCARVAAGAMVATVKVIPFAVPTAQVDRCVAAATAGLAGLNRACAVTPFRPLRAALVLTALDGQPEARLAQAARSIGERLRGLGVALVAEARCRHQTAALARTLEMVMRYEPDLVLVVGASAIVDREDVIPSALVAIGGSVSHFGMPVDPGNLILLGRHGGCEVIGVPSCARSPKRSGFDRVLERLVAGLACGPAEVMGMGVGGLMSDIAPRAEDGEGMWARRLVGVVLAAGSSRRMGPRNKLLVPVAGVAMVARAVDALIDAQVMTEIVVVTGHEADAVREALADRAVRFVHNDDHAEGLASSLRAGVAALGGGADGVLVCLGDMPWVKPATLRALVAAFDPEAAPICAPQYQGKRGNPVVWARGYFSEILRLGGDTGAKELLARHRDEVALVEVDDPGILWDVDTEDALAELASQT